jgi:CHAT domain-containing protein/tetratricopeptide (TPR) repeat protein
LTLAALLTGCHSKPPPEDPAATFHEIRGYFLHGNLDVAQIKAHEARTRFLAVDPNWAMKFRLQEAEILTYQGRRPDVIALLQDKNVFYPETGDIAIERDLLCGFAHARLGQSEQSDRELREAHRLAALSNSNLDGEVLRTDAQIQVLRGHMDEAEGLFRESQQAARRHGDLFLEASDLLNLGWVALQKEHYDEAVASLQKAADFAKTIQALQVVEAAHGNMGDAYYHLGDYERALSSFQTAEKEAKNIGTTSAQVEWASEAGSSYYKLGDLKEAKIYFEQALTGAKAINANEEIAGVETQLALLLYQEGQYESAKVYGDEAVRASRLDGDKSAEAEPLFVQALLATRQEEGEVAKQRLLSVYQSAAGSDYLRWQIEETLAEFFDRRHDAKQAERWYRKSIQTFDTQRASVKDEELKLPFFANGDGLYRDYANFLIVSHRPKEALSLLDLGRARTLAEGLRTSTHNTSSPRRQINPQAVARKLDATILFYSLGPDKSYLWAVTANHTDLFLLPKKQEIESHVLSYQKSILRSIDEVREANVDGRYLYDTIVAPAASLIPPGTKVFIIPDGGLNGLNFETLLKSGGERLHYWIEDVTLTNANSIRLLSRLEPFPSSNDTNNLLLIGNPIASGSKYERLPNAPTEVEDVGKHFRANLETLLTQADAVPSAYAAVKPERFEYIHFVAHGTASRLSPLDSAVILTAPAAHPDDYKLYAREIIRHPLHARLVTISSCYGSGLRAYAGEELVGLSWAFLRAGAHNVIGALWEINDASTPQLMDELYGSLERGNEPDEALRTTKLAMMHSDGVIRKPMYWAAFQLYAGS